MTSTILVVDDNEMNRDMLSRRLQRHNYNVDLAVDGESALHTIRQNSYDLILLDLMMPGMSGYEVLEILKADEATRHIPIIMISAVDDLDSVVRCIEMGAEDYLFKPFNPVLLKARIGATLSKYASYVPIAQAVQIANQLEQSIQTMQESGQLPPESDLPQLIAQLQTILNPVPDGDDAS